MGIFTCAVALACLLLPAQARIYQTLDAVIVEGNVDSLIPLQITLLADWLSDICKKDSISIKSITLLSFEFRN